MQFLKLATLMQGGVRSKNYKRYNLSRVPTLQQRPQVKGIVSRISNTSPKKPNSAVRIVAKVNLTNFTQNISKRFLRVWFSPYHPKADTTADSVSVNMYFFFIV